MNDRTEILAGIHSVTEALRANRRQVIEIYSGEKTPSARIEKILQLAQERNIHVVPVSKERLEALSGTSFHQMIAAKVSAYPFFSTDVRDLLSISSKANRPAFILFLDGIQDSHNLGAILRTALCMGVDGVVIPKDRSVSATPTVSRISVGALEHMRLVEVTNLARSIEAAKEKGVWITGLIAFAEMNLFEGNYQTPTGIVMGSEEKGIRPLVQKQCDFLCKIPQVTELDSMNVSVATAMTLYEVMRQRRNL